MPQGDVELYVPLYLGNWLRNVANLTTQNMEKLLKGDGSLLLLHLHLPSPVGKWVNLFFVKNLKNVARFFSSFSSKKVESGEFICII